MKQKFGKWVDGHGNVTDYGPPPTPTKYKYPWPAIDLHSVVGDALVLRTVMDGVYQDVIFVRDAEQSPANNCWRQLENYREFEHYKAVRLSERLKADDIAAVSLAADVLVSQASELVGLRALLRELHTELRKKDAWVTSPSRQGDV